MKSFDNLHAGDIIENEEDGQMSVMLYDFHGDGKRVLCFASEKSVYLASEFDPEDWEKVELA